MQAVDAQTFYELQILSRNNKDGSILHFFDQTKTQGGQDALKRMIGSPKASREEIISSQQLHNFVSEHVDMWQLSVSRAYIAAAESYYASNISYTMSQDVFKHWVDTLLYSWRNPGEFYLVRSGLTALMLLIRGMRDFTNRFENIIIPDEI